MRLPTTDRRGWLLIPLLCLAAACAGPASTPPASAGASPTRPTPTATATPATSPGGGVRQVTVTIATGNDVAVTVTDGSGLLRDVAAGVVGDGASVEPYRLVVTNDGPSTLRLTWVGGPCDAAATLAIDPSVRSLRLVEPECPGDAVAYDRVLLLHLSAPIDAAGIEAVIQDGLDTTS